MLTEIREGEYRDLHYFYGSYVLSPRLERPTRLQFWIAEEPGPPRAATRVRLRVDSFVRSGRMARLWTRGQRFFWSRFPSWMARSSGALEAAALRPPGYRPATASRASAA